LDERDPVDSIGPWTIKSVAKATREAVTNAAKRENLTVGQWLERRVADWEGQGSSIPVADQAAASPTSLCDLARMMDAARALAETAGVAVPPGLAKEGLATVRRAMRQARDCSRAF